MPRATPLKWMRSCAFGLAGLLLGGTLLAGGPAVDETKPSGRACATLSDAGRETALGPASQPGPDRSLKVHLDASQPCVVLVAAFLEQTGALANDWPPVLLTVEAGEEQTVPPALAEWSWSQPSEPFEIFVAFLPKDLPALDELRGLVAVLNDPLGDSALAAFQAHRLREKLRKWAAVGPAPAEAPSGPLPKVAGTLRSGTQFPWREAARKVSFAAGKPGVIVFRHDGK